MIDAIRGAKPGAAAMVATKVVATMPVAAKVAVAAGGVAAKVAVAAAPAKVAVAAAPAKTVAATALPCPRCKQGALMAGRRGWGCTRWREGCAFVIWFEVAGRRLTAAQLRDLVEKGKTRKSKWAPRGEESLVDGPAGPGSGGDAGRRRRRAISTELNRRHGSTICFRHGPWRR